MFGLVGIPDFLDISRISCSRPSECLKVTLVSFCFREWRMQREKVDFLVAVGEKLCHLDTSTEMQKLEGLTDKSNTAKDEKNHDWDNAPDDHVNIVSEMVSLKYFLCDFVLGR